MGNQRKGDSTKYEGLLKKMYKPDPHTITPLFKIFTKKELKQYY